MEEILMSRDPVGDRVRGGHKPRNPVRMALPQKSPPQFDPKSGSIIFDPFLFCWVVKFYLSKVE